MIRLFPTLQRGVMICLLLGLGASAALAQEGHWYMGLKGGLNAGVEAEAANQGVVVTLESEPGAALLWSVGYALNGLRVEGEVSWRQNDLDSATLPGSLRFQSTGTNTAPAEGSLTNLAVMLNGVYEVELSPLLTPFVLGGIGVSRVTGELERVGSQAFSFDDDKTAFAYQVGVGIDYPLLDALPMEVSYRFFGTPNVQFDDVEVNNTHHAGLFGFTYAF